MELLHFTVLCLLAMACVGLFAAIWAESGWTTRLAIILAVASSAFIVWRD